MPDYVRAKVTGRLPIRDAVTRESVPYGGEVRLLARADGVTRELCARHPKRGNGDLKAACTCGSAIIDQLVADGMIELLSGPKGKS